MHCPKSGCVLLTSCTMLLKALPRTNDASLAVPHAQPLQPLQPLLSMTRTESVQPAPEGATGLRVMACATISPANTSPGAICAAANEWQSEGARPRAHCMGMK